MSRCICFFRIYSKKEWEEGHFHDAIHITLGNLFEKIDSIPKDCPISLQCRTGLRSAIAASILQKAGIKEVVNLKGGFLEWKKFGLPYENEFLSSNSLN